MASEQHESVGMAVDKDKKRKMENDEVEGGSKGGDEYDECETGEGSPSTPASRTGSGNSSNDTTNTALAGIMAMLKQSEHREGDTNLKTREWQHKQNEANLEMRKDLGSCTASLCSLTSAVVGITEKVCTLSGSIDSIAARVTAIEGGGAKGKNGGKGKPPTVHSISSPRGEDPMWMEGGDAWANSRAAGLGFVHENSRPSQASAGGGGAWAGWSASDLKAWATYSSLSATAPSANPHARPLAQRVGDRKTIIVGGFPSDTGRDEIETTLRGIVGHPNAIAEGTSGVTKVMSMGRYATCGRIEFSGNNAMWAFIKENKRKKFDFDGVKEVLWFSVEKTDYERLRSAKLSAILQRLVDFFMEKHSLTKPEVKKIVDGDYTRGYVMFIRQEKKETASDGVESVTIKKYQQRIFDSKDGDTYFVTEGAREIEEFKNFDWDEAIAHSNAMISKAEAYNNRAES
jgi:hypothetical protein